MTTTETSPRMKGQTVNVGDAERTVSMVAGGVLAASAVEVLRQKKMVAGLAMLATGGLLFYRGKSGHCSMYGMLGVSTAEKGVRLEKTVTVNRPPQEVYAFWHNIENLPRFMKHLEAVRATGEGKSHWVAKGPGGITIEWDAETTEDRPAECISWRSAEGADISNEGKVEFSEAPGGRGTELKVRITYNPPMGAAGAVAAGMINNFNAQEIEEDLKRFKQVMESGEIATAARTLQ